MKNCINLGESLNEILSDRAIKIKDLAEAVGVSQATVYSWLKNETEPNLAFLISMANFFKCSIEFLIGRSVDERYIEIKNQPPLTKSIKRAMKEAGISTYKLRNISKYDGAYFYNWEHGSEPLLSTLVELSDILDCTVDYLVGRV